MSLTTQWRGGSRFLEPPEVFRCTESLVESHMKDPSGKRGLLPFNYLYANVRVVLTSLGCALLKDFCLSCATQLGMLGS